MATEKLPTTLYELDASGVTSPIMREHHISQWLKPEYGSALAVIWVMDEDDNLEPRVERVGAWNTDPVWILDNYIRYAERQLTELKALRQKYAKVSR